MTLPFIDPIELGDWCYPLTLLGIVAVMNVVNFTDGADGLAAGVCTIAAATFALIALSLNRDAAGVLAALTAGAAIGFLWHNFHPASIFMGDAGSNLLGLLLACVAIQGVLKTAAVVALFFPLLILAVPALDATFVVAKRIKYGRPVYSADRWHFHHRFANIGFSQRRTVLYLYGWTLSLAALALAMRFVPYSDDDGTLHVGWTLVIVAFALIAVAASVYLVIVLEILKFKRFRERELRRQVETGEIAALSEAEIERRDRPRGGDRRVPGRCGCRPRRTTSRPSAGLTVLFRRRSLDGIRAGEITLAFRRWDRPRARAGGRQRTVVGELAIDSVEPVDRGRDHAGGRRARRARVARRAARRARRARRRPDLAHRVALGRRGPAPRAARARRPRRRGADGAARAAGAPRRSEPHGPWTRQTLDLIAAHPELRAEDLAALGRPREAPFKRDVRKLKELGLTESLLIGYRLSPRGRALLDARPTRDACARPTCNMLGASTRCVRTATPARGGGAAICALGVRRSPTPGRGADPLPAAPERTRRDSRSRSALGA